MKQIAFIGGGNMAEGIIAGSIKGGSLKPEDIYVYNRTRTKTEFLVKTYGIKSCNSIGEVFEVADTVVLSVRPQDVKEVMDNVKGYVSRDKLVVSVCAGIKIETFESYLGSDKKICRVMPNTLTKAGHGYSAVCYNSNTSEQDFKNVKIVMESIGQVMEIKEDMFDMFTAFSNVGPAYLLFVMSSLIDAGVRCGFSRKDAKNIVIENMIGTAMKVNEEKIHPWQIIDTMAAPAGVTIEAVASMHKSGIAGGIMDAVDTSVKRVEELA